MSMCARIERLQQRVLLSVTVRDGLLKIVGNDGADDLVLTADSVFINVFDVRMNGSTTYVSIADSIKQVDIRTHGGNDTVELDKSLDSMGLRMFVDAGPGDDRISTGPTDDTVIGGDGDDKLYGNAGNDRLYGEGGRDRLFGGAGRDMLDGGPSNDCLYANKGNDALHGGGGNDRLEGGDGADHLFDKSGTDSSFGGLGNDTGEFSDDGEIHGGDGGDTIVSSRGATVFGDAGDDTLTGTVVWGGDGEDTITGTSGPDHLWGDAGEDLVRGGGGPDHVSGGEGHDAVYGGDDRDTVHGDGGDDNLYGDDGVDHDNSHQTGHDIGFGDAGSDWFEPTHHWQKVDANEADGEKHNKSQNHLSQDPSYGYYGYSYNSSGAYGSVTRFGSDWYTGGTVTIGGNQIVVDPGISVFKSLGVAGFLIGGYYQRSIQQFIPGPTNPSDRQALRPVILKLPGFHLGEMSAGEDGIVWFNLISGEVGDGERSKLVETYEPNQHQFGTFRIPTSVLGAVDTFRFLAVKAGTVILPGAITSGDPLYYKMDAPAIPIGNSGDVRIAGQPDTYHLASTYSSVPADVPKGVRGILTAEGAVWLPTDGSGAMFTPD